MCSEGNNVQEGGLLHSIFPGGCKLYTVKSNYSFLMYECDVMLVQLYRTSCWLLQLVVTLFQAIAD
jgi:hypothetical protein